MQTRPPKKLSSSISVVVSDILGASFMAFCGGRKAQVGKKI
ncbi:hypothetical protein CEV31_1227 [Brucella thiophenivorans]|uniref:Uncharacterized protein n=1 Tax=Brucella thiophenivorans TaxID=571255 RepID=A0A256FYA6_9HYPH|nr:hypothetical protein CEV31_1227 [Brucella thiophenivorans]